MNAKLSNLNDKYYFSYTSSFMIECFLLIEESLRSRMAQSARKERQNILFILHWIGTLNEDGENLQPSTGGFHKWFELGRQEE